MSEQGYTLDEASVVAENVTFEQYMREYADQKREWIRGAVLKMSPVGLRHNEILRYLVRLIETYLAFKPVGRLVDEFVMRGGVGEYQFAFEPDIQILLNKNVDTLKETYVDGAADICIEIVSPGSVERDYGEKLVQYERAGVREYWLIDPMRQSAVFYRLSEGLLIPTVAVDYTTPKLPDFVLNVPTLWRETLPNPVEVVDMVREMVKEA